METYNLHNKGLPSSLLTSSWRVDWLEDIPVWRWSNVPLLEEGVGARVPSSRGPWCHCGM